MTSLHLLTSRFIPSCSWTYQVCPFSQSGGHGVRVGGAGLRAARRREGHVDYVDLAYEEDVAKRPALARLAIRLSVVLATP